MRVRYLFLFLLLTQPAAAQVVEGTVVDAVTGGAIAGARVKLEANPLDPIYTRTDANGQYRFAKPPLAGYTIWADAPGYLTPLRCAIPRCSLTAYAVISGQVTDPNGVPLPEAEVEVLQQRPGGPPVHKAQIYADDQGRFRAARLEAGTYYVVANRPQAAGWEPDYHPTYYPGVVDPASARPLELAAGTKAQVDIRILRLAGVRIAGRLIKPQSGNRLQTQIVIIPLNTYLANPRQSTVTAGEEFALTNTLPGRYTLAAVGRPEGNNPWTIEAEFGALQTIEVTDHDVTGLEVALRPLPDLNGTVTFAEGCKDVPVRIRARGSPAVFMASKDTIPGPDGTFVLQRLFPGKYTLSVEPAIDLGQMPVTSVRLGGREVPKEGFDAPFAAGETLILVVGCGARRPQ
jgi:hypothetical protein